MIRLGLDRKCIFLYLELGTRAGLTIVPVVPWEGPPPPGGPSINCQNFYHAVLTFERSVCVGLNVTTTTKKGRQLFGEEKCTPKKVHAQKKILAMRMRKVPPPYVWMGPLIINPALRMSVTINHY